jgi:hypothetical protein
MIIPGFFTLRIPAIDSITDWLFLGFTLLLLLLSWVLIILCDRLMENKK